MWISRAGTFLKGVLFFVCIVRSGVAGAFRWDDFGDGARGWSHIHIGFGGVWDYRAVEENWGGKLKRTKNGGG
jgi:hypothetical protein